MRADDLSPSADRADDPSCLQLLDQAVAGRKGIVNVAVDTADETITFAYDPHRVAEEQPAARRSRRVRSRVRGRVIVRESLQFGDGRRRDVAPPLSASVMGLV